MRADIFQSIDWSRPWLAHVRESGMAIAESPDWRAELNRRAERANLRNHRDLPIRFVPQAELPTGVAYEAHISQTGCVPTRDNLHDFFNALVWLTFPRIKVQLNALQASEIAKAAGDTSSSPRGKVRDAATIFDENAVFLITEDEGLVTSLRSHAWIETFHAQRNLFNERCTVLLFGHALMEKLVVPYKAITGHMWVIAANSSSLGKTRIDQFAALDLQVAEQLKIGLSTKAFSPLPILGIPDWWQDQDENFYQDVTVFRPKRT